MFGAGPFAGTATGAASFMNHGQAIGAHDNGVKGANLGTGAQPHQALRNGKKIASLLDHVTKATAVTCQRLTLPCPTRVIGVDRSAKKP